jgi:hypothetical protein
MKNDVIRSEHPTKSEEKKKARHEKKKRVREDTYQVIQPIFPQGFARQHIQLLSRCAFWEYGTIDRDL